MDQHKAGFVSIIGKPNVGKSTLMNQMIGERLSIITSKAQTTRHRILGVLNGDDFQIVYSDTPGIIKPKYELHIITNGFDNTQARKMESSELTHYFDVVVTSELAGYKKPHRAIFDFAVEHTGSDRDLSIMIGDNLDTDIKGARDADLDQIFYNPENIDHDSYPTFEINGLDELTKIL